MQLRNKPEPGLIIEKIRGSALWCDFVNSNFSSRQVLCDENRDFNADIRLCRIGEQVIASIGADGCSVACTSRNVRQAESGFVKMLWRMHGRISVEQDGRHCSLAEGDVAVCDTARPYRVWLADNAKFAILLLPYAAIPGWERLSQTLSGSVLPDRTTSRATLAASLALLNNFESQRSEGADSVMQAIQWMLSAALHRSAARYSHDKHSASKLDAAHQYIMAHIDDPELNPDELANTLHLSRRGLYLMFKEHKVTPARFIQKIRLRAVQAALLGAYNTHRSIFEIALDHGFTDSATFSRVFKAACGMSPRAWRLQRQDMVTSR